MAKPTDDLEAVRVVADALKEFQKDEQERIIRWARERIGLSTTLPTNVRETSGASTAGSGFQPQVAESVNNIKSFMEQKKPKSDNQFAVAVAYYHRFEAPESQRKSEINSDDLLEACRLAQRGRMLHPQQVLINLRNQGLLDKGSEKGKYSINTVGENLVAMVLPSGASGAVKKIRRPKERKSRTRR
ncbi:MAG TPA: hypothetical protein VI685_09080 [Candidatus Angelobacter sp.]